MGNLTERKLMGIVGDLFPDGMHPDYRTGLLAGLHGINISNPCPTKNVHCAEGVAAGRSLREYFLCFSGPSDDELVAQNIAGLLCIDPKKKTAKKSGKEPRIVSLDERRRVALLKEQEDLASEDADLSVLSFNNVIRLAEST